jgi:glutathione S-transferase
MSPREHASPAGPELFWVSGSPYAWRVQLALQVKQVPYTSRLLEFSKGDLKTPEYLKINPRGKAPTLRDGDFVLGESLAIMAYLDRKHPEPPLFGKNALETGRIWELISEFVSYLNVPLGRIVSPIYFGKTAEKVQDIQAALPAVHEELGRFEKAAGPSGWFAGDLISAADIAIYPFIKSLLRAASKEAAAPLNLGLLPLEARWPRLAGWMTRVEAIPGYDATYPPHWRQG